MDSIRDINKTMGVTIIYVTHEPEEARLLEAGSAGILTGGRVTCVGHVESTLAAFLKKHEGNGNTSLQDYGK